MVAPETLAPVLLVFLSDVDGLRSRVRRCEFPHGWEPWRHTLRLRRQPQEG